MISAKTWSILASQKSIILVELDVGIGDGAWLMFIVHPCKFCRDTHGRDGMPAGVGQ